MFLGLFLSIIIYVLLPLILSDPVIRQCTEQNLLWYFDSFLPDGIQKKSFGRTITSLNQSVVEQWVKDINVN